MDAGLPETKPSNRIGVTVLRVWIPLPLNPEPRSTSRKMNLHTRSCQRRVVANEVGTNHNRDT